MTEFLLVHQAQAIPQATAQDGSGATVPVPIPNPPAFVAGIAPVPCLLQQDASRRTDDQGKVRATTTCQVYFARDPGVKPGDRLIVLAGGKARVVRCDGPALDRAGLGDLGGLFAAATTLRVDGTLVA